MITLVQYSFQNNEPIESDIIDLKCANFEFSKFEVIFQLHILHLIIYYKFMKLFFKNILFFQNKFTKYYLTCICGSLNF